MIAEITGPVTAENGVGGPGYTMVRFPALLDGKHIPVMYSTNGDAHGEPPQLHEGQLVDLRGTILKDPKGNMTLLASSVEPAA